MQKRNPNKKHAKTTTSSKKTMFLKNKPNLKDKTLETKRTDFYSHATTFGTKSPYNPKQNKKPVKVEPLKMN